MTETHVVEEVTDFYKKLYESEGTSELEIEAIYAKRQG